MTDEITETGYTEGSYGLFGIAVFYGVPGTRNIGNHHSENLSATIETLVNYEEYPSA